MIYIMNLANKGWICRNWTINKDQTYNRKF